MKLCLLGGFMIKYIMDLKKLDNKEKELVDRALRKLENQINVIESTGTPFEKIFNNYDNKFCCCLFFTRY